MTVMGRPVSIQVGLYVSQAMPWRSETQIHATRWRHTLLSLRRLGTNPEPGGGRSAAPHHCHRCSIAPRII